MKSILLIVLGLWINSSFVWAQKTEIVFEVSFKNKKIGTIHAVEEAKGNRVIKDLKTNTDTKVLMIAVHVESEVTVVTENNILIEGTAYRHANRGPEDIHARVKKTGDKTYQFNRDGKQLTLQNEVITECMIDLYFKEPKNSTTVFSNMYGKKLVLKSLGGNRYQLITPDNKDSYYTYKNGKLISVEADTPVGKVISNRI